MLPMLLIQTAAGIAPITAASITIIACFRAFLRAVTAFMATSAPAALAARGEAIRPTAILRLPAPVAGVGVVDVSKVSGGSAGVLKSLRQIGKFLDEFVEL